MNRFAYTTLLSVTLVFGAACGDDDGGSGLTVADLCGETGGFVDIFEKTFNCVPEFLEFFGGAPTSTELAAICDATLGGFVEDGTVLLPTRAELDACLAAVDTATCDTFNLNNVPECDDLLVGTIALGEDCETNDQCVGDAYCDESGSGTCGQCTPQKADDASCEDDNECLNNRCSIEEDMVRGTCRSFGFVGDSCLVNDDCSGRLSCNSVSMQCTAEQVWNIGDTCATFEDDCGFPFSDMYCAAGSTDQCTAYLNVGDTCTGGAGICQLFAYEWCDEQGTGRCIAPTTRNALQSCGIETGEKCADGLLCSVPFGGGGVCVDPVPGSTCDSTDPDSLACGIFLDCQDDNTCQYDGDYTGMCPSS
jgi:hypothetical protein